MFNSVSDSPLGAGKKWRPLENPILKSVLPLTLAFSIGVSAVPVALAAPGDVNSTNTGRDIQSGTYFNTPGSRTTFQNPGGGLFLHSGDLVRGLESDISKTPTGNGGTLYFRASGNVIRLDGNIDVSALRSGSMYLGNGGKVFVDSAYLFQNGSIFANGFNGGLIQFNVGSMTVGPNARITAMGFGGNGGAINIQSPGAVDIRSGAVLDTSGKVIGTFDTNIINIEGGLVNNDGIIRANGVAGTDFKADNGDAAVIAANPGLLNNPPPGTISGGVGQGVIMGAPQPFSPPGPPTARGGTIRLVANGRTWNANATISGADAAILASEVKSSLISRNNSLLVRNGSVTNNNQLLARGGAGQDGGSILLAAADDVNNFGTLDANGGNGVTSSGNGTNGGHGGTVGVFAMDRVVNHGFIQANGGTGGNAASLNVQTKNGQDAVANVTSTAGRGGDGGAIAFSYQTMENKGKINANGGLGGIGGNANAFDSEVATTSTGSATARAVANAGDGGQGGSGGLIVLSGNANPTGGGQITALGGRGGRGGNAFADARVVVRNGTGFAITETTAGAGGTGGLRGTVVAPNPGDLPSTQVYLASNGGLGNGGSQQRIRVVTKNGANTVGGEFIGGIPGTAQSGPHNTIQQTRRNELILHAENGFLLSRADGAGTVSSTLSGRLNDSVVRTVDSPLGTGGNALESVRHKSNFVVAGINPNPLTNDIPNGNADPVFTNLTTLTMLNNGNIDNDMHWAPGVHQVGPGFHDSELSLGGGHINFLSRGSIINDGFLLSRGLWTGGSITLAANQDIINNNVILNTAFNKHTASGFTMTPGYISSHSGSINLKAGGNIVNNDKLNAAAGFGEVHPPLNGLAWLPTLNAGQIGSTIYAQAGGNITNANGALWAADVFNYRDTTVDQGAQNPTSSIGGIISLDAGGSLSGTSAITTTATSFQGSTGNFRFTSTDGFTTLPGTNGVIIEE